MKLAINLLLLNEIERKVMANCFFVPINKCYSFLVVPRGFCGGSDCR